MSKGLGAKMALVKMAMDTAAIKEGTLVACPFCGKPMWFNGCVWTCRSGRDFCGERKACGVPQAVVDGFDHSPEKRDFAINEPGVPAVTFGAVFDGDRMLVTFGPRRGYAGQTSLVIIACGIEKPEIAGSIQRLGWEWQDWVADHVKVNERGDPK